MLPQRHVPDDHPPTEHQGDRPQALLSSRSSDCGCKDFKAATKYVGVPPDPASFSACARFSFINRKQSTLIIFTSQTMFRPLTRSVSVM